MRLLIIEDSSRLRESLQSGLRSAGYAVDATGDGNHGLRLALDNVYDVVILDLMLPGKDGVSILQTMRNSQNDTYVLILTAKDRVEDKVNCLQRGADDYLVKPFAFDELLARIQALVRRKHNSKNPVIVIRDVKIDTNARSVTRDGLRLDLSAREYATLEYLAVRRGQILSRAQIEAHIYDDRADPMSNVVDTVIYSLRKKIDTSSTDSIIRTRRGMGYEIESEET